jgi:hypothetical protein
MYLCQCVEEMFHGLRYARAAFYRVARDIKGKLVWKRHHAANWVLGFTPLRPDGTYGERIPAVKRARNYFLKRVLVHNGVQAGQTVSAAHAMRLTGLTLPQAARDYLLEQDLDAIEPVLMPEKPRAVKPKPTPAELARKEADRCDEKVAELDRRIRRLETLRDKWSRRSRYYQTRTRKLEKESLP